MKKNDWILLATVALYSFLFFEQSAGINFLIFNLALIAALLIRNRELITSKSWNLAAGGSILSAVCIALYGNGLAVTANILSLSMLSALSDSKKNSVIVSLLFSFYSYASSIVFMFMDWQQRNAEKNKLNTGTRKWRLILIPVIITLLFFFMYRSSNVLFNDFTKNINLDFISWNWISFTFGGFILLYGFFYHQKIKSIAVLEANSRADIDPLNAGTITVFGKQLTINDEEFSGKLLFILLNLLLLIVNTLDIRFMFFENKLPDGITYSAFVHQGTGMLITSLVIAIAIILFYFRGALNFSEKSKTIKLVAYLWIAQNAFMILSTLLRNNMYVSEYGLTYKRIGVYVYLILTLLGLITTFVKILKIKTNAYLFRVNAWLFYFVLIISVFVNWDGLIADFNINKAKRVQTDYLLNLSYSVLPALYTYSDSSMPIASSYSVLDYNKNFERDRDGQLYYFLEAHDKLSWKSWYYNDKKTYSELKRLEINQKITRLDLSAKGIVSVQPLWQFNSIHSLNLMSNKVSDLNELIKFTMLKELNLRDNKFSQLKSIGSLKDLELLDIRQNPIVDYSPLFELKKLKTLYVDASISQTDYEVLEQKLSQTKIIKG